MQDKGRKDPKGPYRDSRVLLGYGYRRPDARRCCVTLCSRTSTFRGSLTVGYNFTMENNDLFAYFSFPLCTVVENSNWYVCVEMKVVVKTNSDPVLVTLRP